MALSAHEWRFPPMATQSIQGENAFFPVAHEATGEQ
jgi:hypothetical protein